MEKIRIGNDIKIQVALNASAPELLDVAKIRVFAVESEPKKPEIPKGVVVMNPDCHHHKHWHGAVVELAVAEGAASAVVAVWKAEQQRLGVWDIVVAAETPSGSRAAGDIVEAIMIVRHTEEEDGAAGAVIADKVLDLGVITLTVGGLSAYELAVANGYEGTLEEWLESLKLHYGDLTTAEIDELQRPAVSAAEDAIRAANHATAAAEEARTYLSRLPDAENIATRAELERKLDKSGTAHIDGDVYVGSMDSKKSLTVSGTTRLKGQTFIREDIIGVDIGETQKPNITNIGKVESDSVTTRDLQVIGSVEIAGTLRTRGQNIFGGGIQMNGHDIENVQSITVTGTARLQGDTKTKSVAPTEDKKSNIGKPTARYKRVYTDIISNGEVEIPVSEIGQGVKDYNDLQNKPFVRKTIPTDIGEVPYAAFNKDELTGIDLLTPEIVTFSAEEKTLAEFLEEKQDTLTAGENITIENGVISASGGGGKPSGGWQKTDLAADVQASLGKADTALQEHQDISGKVDKVAGKGLSANDYTDEEKQKLTDVAKRTAGISYKSIGDTTQITTDTTEVHDLEAYSIDTELLEVRGMNVYNAVMKKVEKQEGKGLSTNDYTDEEKEKVAEIGNKYKKPSGGIPTTDLSTDLQTSINRADAIYNDYINAQNLM